MAVRQEVCPMTQTSTRRRFLRAGAAVAGLGLLAGCSAIPSVVQSRPKIRRIGNLAEIAEPPSGTHSGIEALRQGLRELGWIEGQNYAIEFRWAAGNRERLPELAAELIRLGVDLIYTVTTPEAVAAQQATTMLPIIATSPADPVLQGLATSFARPGGNLTGLSSIDHELHGKRIELLEACAPGIARLAAFRYTQGIGSIIGNAHIRELEAGARAFGIDILYADLSEALDFDAALSGVMPRRPDALFVLPNGPINLRSAQIAELALKYRLPGIGAIASYPRNGLLLGYGTNPDDLFRRSAVYVDKIFKGANPAELPIEKPSKFDFVINLKTAATLGLTIPQAVLSQATDVVQ
jgi:putative ABC transport system substrate-binding protein